MSEKLKTMREGECLDDSYGLDGDGLCEGEVACEEEITWPFCRLGVLDGVGTRPTEAGKMRRCGLGSGSLGAQKRARSVIRSGEGGNPG